MLRRTVSSGDGRQLTAIMEGVVERGTAKSGADSTATRSPARPAPRPSSINGRYSKSDYNASFVGFVPSRKPALTILVVIDSPHGKRLLRRRRRGAGLQAIAEAALRHLGVAPTSIAPPPVLVADRSADHADDQPVATAAA